jgi:metal-responsive CopG/Arc/MetJ family transcriptional regulator
VKTTISIPDPLFAQAEQVAKRLRMSRSKLYATAIAQFVNANRSRDITERLNEVYAKEKSKLDPVLHALQLRSLNQGGRGLRSQAGSLESGLDRRKR